MIGPVFLSPGAGIGGIGLGSFFGARAGLPPRGRPDGAALIGAEPFAGFMGALPLAGEAAFGRATFEGLVAVALRATLAPVPFATGGFTRRAGAFVFLTAAFFTTFLPGFFAALLTDLAAFLAGFFAAAIGKYLVRKFVIASMRRAVRRVNAPGTPRGL